MTSRVEKARWKVSVPIRDRDSLRLIRDGTAVRFPSMNISWTCPTGESKSVSGKRGGGKCRVSLSTQNESTTSTDSVPDIFLTSSGILFAFAGVKVFSAPLLGW